MADAAGIINILDRDGALRLDEDRGDYGTWPEIGDSEIALPVDFDALGRDDQSMNDHLSDIPPSLDHSPNYQSSGISVRPDIVDAVLGGGAGVRGRDNAFPPIDVHAWYQPIHFFANNWGIFIRETSLIHLAVDLAPRLARFRDRRSTYSHVAVLLRAAFTYASFMSIITIRSNRSRFGFMSSSAELSTRSTSSELRTSWLAPTTLLRRPSPTPTPG